MSHRELTHQFQRWSLFLPASLHFAEDLANRLHHPAPKEWRDVAEGLKIPFDQASQYHPEYDGYVKGDSLPAG